MCTLKIHVLVYLYIMFVIPAARQNFNDILKTHVFLLTVPWGVAMVRRPARRISRWIIPAASGANTSSFSSSTWWPCCRGRRCPRPQSQCRKSWPTSPQTSTAATKTSRQSSTWTRHRARKWVRQIGWNLLIIFGFYQLINGFKINFGLFQVRCGCTAIWWPEFYGTRYQSL